jgi:hypothetical protein
MFKLVTSDCPKLILHFIAAIYSKSAFIVNGFRCPSFFSSVSSDCRSLGTAPERQEIQNMELKYIPHYRSVDWTF